MYKVYWTYGNETYGQEFVDMIAALNECQSLRNSGRSFVTMVSENTNVVGKPGVDAVSEDNVLPDGTPYTWKKRRK